MSNRKPCLLMGNAAICKWHGREVSVSSPLNVVDARRGYTGRGRLEQTVWCWETGWFGHTNPSSRKESHFCNKISFICSCISWLGTCLLCYFLCFFSDQRLFHPLPFQLWSKYIYLSFRNNIIVIYIAVAVFTGVMKYQQSSSLLRQRNVIHRKVVKVWWYAFIKKHAERLGFSS